MERYEEVLKAGGEIFGVMFKKCEARIFRVTPSVDEKIMNKWWVPLKWNDAKD